jgi:hypothetical protein
MYLTFKILFWVFLLITVILIIMFSVLLVELDYILIYFLIF